MMPSLENVYLDSCLMPLAHHLARADITDIYINRPGELWVETLGGTISRVEARELDRDTLARLARQIAASTAQGINRQAPLLAASLPTGERVQIIIPPATRGEIAIAIRKHVAPNLTLEDFGDFSTRDSKPPDRKRALLVENVVATSSDAVVLRNAVRDRRNILISGGTSSGKTTLLNVLLREIPVAERLILIEDTPELMVAHENSVGLIATRGNMGEADVNAEDLLIAALRMRPDRIILGEIRGSEATTFLRAINTGHPGSISTVHADSPTRAIDQLALLVLQTGMRLNWRDVTTYVRQSLDFIVQMERGAGGRRIRSIYALRDDNKE